MVVFGPVSPEEAEMDIDEEDELWLYDEEPYLLPTTGTSTQPPDPLIEQISGRCGCAYK